MSNFYEGQKVVCISEDFPICRTTNIDKSRIGVQAPTGFHPVKGETLIIDEMLGDFLRFDKYDFSDPNHPYYGFNWWHSSRFRPLEEIGITSNVEELQEVV